MRCSFSVPVILTMTTILAVMVRTASAEGCARIVTLAPSLTELALALGLDDNIVGVSRYDDLLLEKKDSGRGALPRIGDLFDIHLETLLAAKPSVVILLEEQRHFQERIKGLGLDVLILRQKTITDIHDALRHLGEYCGLARQSQKVERELFDQMEGVAKELRASADFSSEKSRVLVVIGFDTSSSEMRNIFVSGSDGFYFEILKQLGAEPAFHGKTGHLNTLSLEGLMVLRPTHILHILPPSHPLPTRDELSAFWKPFSELPAVQSGRIFARGEGYFSLPGVQYPKVAEAFSNILKEL